MSISVEARLRQVQRYGIGLRRLSKFLFALAAFGATGGILLLAFGTSANTHFAIAGAVYAADAVPLVVRAVGIGTVILAGGLLLRLLFHMIRLFDLYACGKIFTADNVRHMRQIGVTVFLFTMLWFVDLVSQFMLAPVAPGIDARDVTVGVDSVQPVVDAQTYNGISIDLGDPFSIVILGTVIVFFSWIMDVGRELREEQDLVV